LWAEMALMCRLDDVDFVQAAQPGRVLLTSSQGFGACQIMGEGVVVGCVPCLPMQGEG